MTQAHVPTDWHPASWQSRHAAQQPVYRDRANLENVLSQLSKLPPRYVVWGDGTSDEMCIGIMTVSPRKS